MKKLAVLLPTFNAAQYLQQSIDSVLGQSFGDFDLYVLDDCSTDHTAAVVKSYKDPRIHYQRNGQNLGISKTLNAGLQALLGQYEFIARMDADDCCYPQRFEKQLKHLAQHPEIAVLGTQGFWLKNLEEQPENGWEYPENSCFIRYQLLFTPCFGHSSVMLRSADFQKHHFRYSETIQTCEDWDLWSRIATVAPMANLKDFLMKYRILAHSNHRHPEKLQKHQRERASIIAAYWNTFQILLTEQDVYDFYFSNDKKTDREFKAFLNLFISAFNKVFEQAKKELGPSELKLFAHLLSRKLRDFRIRSGHGPLDVIFWTALLGQARFSGKPMLIKNTAR